MITQLPPILSKEADQKWQAFCEACANKAITPPVDPQITGPLKYVFALSDFVATSCAVNPGHLTMMIVQERLDTPCSKEGFKAIVKEAMAGVNDEKTLGEVLREIRAREMLRIAIRDIAGHAGLTETMDELSSFAGVCVESAFSFLYNKLCETWGTPMSEDRVQQHICVLGLGKLGGNELNFSSDIDLIFAYPDAGNTTGTEVSVSCDEFFTLLCRNFLKVFGKQGGAGNLFRVDLRLRPFGENGPIATSFNSTELYYMRQGREWERYALVKAKPIAGDISSGETLLKRLNPFIYRRYFDYGAYESLREMKRMILSEVKRKGLETNIKLGSGGIREIEFFGQMFQLIRGGVEPELQDRSILNVLNCLVAGGYIPPVVNEELSEAYIFLRNCEHRLQEFSDQQTHDLPSDENLRLKLAISMGYLDYTTFEEALNKHRKNVNRHFTAILEEKEDDKNDPLVTALSEAWMETGDRDTDLDTLSRAGFNDPSEACRLLGVLKDDFNTKALSSTGRHRLDKLMPLLLKETGASDFPDLSLKRLLDLVKTIERRTCYISLLIEKHEILIHLVSLASMSPWIINYLATHPVLLDELIDPRKLYTPPERNELKAVLDHQLSTRRTDDLEMVIELLIIFKQTHTLRVAAADVSGLYPLMKVSDYLTDIAETIINKTLALSWDYLVKKHGTPLAGVPPLLPGSGFAVIGYGKLGGIELGYGSDLDLVFLCNPPEGSTHGEAPVSNFQFYSRMGQRIIHLLTTYTRAGKMYEVDLRLRPGGISGPVVSTMPAFRDYLMDKAWIFEHQALVRSRAICGDPEIMKQFEELRITVISQPRQPNQLRSEIKAMRDKMRQEHGKKMAGGINIKSAEGGIVDIEFIVQYLVLSGAYQTPMLGKYSDNIRQIDALSEYNVIDRENAEFLKNAYVTLRHEVHGLTLQEKPPVVPDTEFSHIRNGVKKLWHMYFQ